MQVIDSVRWILENPVDTDSSDSDRTVGFRLTWGYVLEQIPQVLRAAAYTPESYSAACNILWTLAQDDRRPTQQFPNHPLRVLRELAAYTPEKPVSYNRLALELAEILASV